MLDGRCIVPLGLQSHSAVRQCTLIPRDEESSEDDRPFQPRFLLQETILAHSPHEGVFHNRPSLQGNLLPIRPASLEWNCGDRVHDPPGSRARCFSSVQGVRTSESSGAPLGASVPAGPSASRRIPLAVRSSALVWSLGRAASPCSGRTDSIHDADLDRWKLRSQSGHKAAPRPVGAPLLQARVNKVTVGRWAKSPLAKHPKSDQSRPRLLSNSVDSQCVGSKFSTSPAEPREIGRSGTEPSRGACSCRPLSGRPA